MPVFVYLPTEALEKEFRLIYCAEVHSVHLNKGARLLLEWAGPLENDTKPAFCDGNPIPIFYKEKTRKKEQICFFFIQIYFWGSLRPRSAHCLDCGGGRERMMTNNSDHEGDSVSSPLRGLGGEIKRVLTYNCKKDSLLVNNVTCSHAFCISSPLSLDLGAFSLTNNDGQMCIYSLYHP